MKKIISSKVSALAAIMWSMMADHDYVTLPAKQIEEGLPMEHIASAWDVLMELNGIEWADECYIDGTNGHFIHESEYQSWVDEHITGKDNVRAAFCERVNAKSLYPSFNEYERTEDYIRACAYKQDIFLDIFKKAIK